MYMRNPHKQFNRCIRKVPFHTLSLNSQILINILIKFRLQPIKNCDLWVIPQDSTPSIHIIHNMLRSSGYLEPFFVSERSYIATVWFKPR